MDWFLRYALLRLRARWRSLATMIIGVLLAAFIGANASLYTTGIAQVGMVQYLAAQSPADVNLYARTSLSPADTEDFAARWQAHDRAVDGIWRDGFPALAAWTGEPITFAETQPLFPVLDGEDIGRAEVNLAYYDALDQHADLLAGAWPQDNLTAVAAEVLLGEQAATALGLEVGTVLDLEQRGWDSSQPFTVRVSGIITAIDPADSYWFEPSPLRLEGTSIAPEVVLLTTRAALENIPPRYLPQPQVQIGWRLALDHRALPFSRIETAQQSVADYEERLIRQFRTDAESQGNFVFLTELPALLDQYAQQIVFLNIPFGLLLVQLGALVLFFLVLIAALVQRGERREIAMLQSRGATDRQIILARSIEAAVIALAAAGVAPFLAQAVLRWYIPVFMNIEQVPLELTPAVFAFSLGVSSLAFVFLLLTLLPVLHQPLISAGGAGARSATQTWWQRYYLDVVLLIVGGAALFQLTRSQSAVAISASGGVQVDPLLLLAPTLLFVAFSSVLLRFFPGMMQAIARFFSARRGLEGALASWQVSREPLHYGRIAFLLALAIGIGWFAISYQATLLGNQNDQAAYFVGGDVRVVFDNNADQADVEAAIATILADDTVRDGLPVARIELPSVATASGRRSRQAGDLLALDTERLVQVIDWRSDLGTLMVPAGDTLIPSDTGAPLPPDAQTLRFDAYLEGRYFINFGQSTEDRRPYPQALIGEGVFEADLVDADDVVMRVPANAQSAELEAFVEEIFNTMDDPSGTAGFFAVDTDGDGQVDDAARYDWPDDGWMRFEIDLTALERDMTTALRLRNLKLMIPSVGAIDPLMQMTNFQIVRADGRVQPLDWLDVTWDVQRALNAEGPTALTVTDAVRADRSATAIEIEWMSVGGFNSAGVNVNFLLNTPEIATVTVSSRRAVSRANNEQADEAIRGLPALASESFMQLNEFERGQRFDLVVDTVSPWFEAVDVISYYPTLYAERPFVVVDYDKLAYTLARTGQDLVYNELWLDLTPSADQNALLDRIVNALDNGVLETIYTTERTLSGYQTDVLSLGVIGLLFISFTVGLALSVVSLFTYISLTVQSRLTEFAVLRALGFTTGRMIVSIIIEQGLVLLSAMILGAVIGQFLTMQVLPPLALSAAGGSVTPPLILRLDLLALLRYLFVIIIMLVIVLLISAIWVRRAATADALRLVED